MNEPLVTAICLTRNRRQWLPLAIRYFQAQTYPSRELLILADGENVSDLIPDDPQIRLVEVPIGLKIGAKRNLGCELARGEIICHWDDDDFSAPQRIAMQVARLLESGKSVAGYSPMYFQDSARVWWKCQAFGPRVIGTSLMYRKGWWAARRFPDKQIGEENGFITEALYHKEIVSDEAGLLMAATIHDGNTSKRNLKSGMYVQAAGFAGVPGMEWPCA